MLGKGGDDEITAGPDLRGLTSLVLHGGDPGETASVSGVDVVSGSDSDDMITGGDAAITCGGQVDDVAVSDPSDTVDAD